MKFEQEGGMCMVYGLAGRGELVPASVLASGKLSSSAVKCSLDQLSATDCQIFDDPQRNLLSFSFGRMMILR